MISAILHTRNRPQFLRRALEYYNNKLSIPLYIIDASDDYHFNEIKKIVANNKSTFPCTLLHHNPKVSIAKRILDALLEIDTPFVTLMADDDFYSPSWFERSSVFLQANQAYVVAYGHSIFFQIDNYASYGTISSFWNHNYFPPRVWLEDDDVGERIKSLSKYPISSVGWYATHKYETLKNITNLAYENNIDGMSFELLLHVLQPIYGRIAMLDEVYLARQQNISLSRYDLYLNNRKALNLVKRISRYELIRLYQIEKDTATKLINNMLKHDINSLILTEVYSRLGFPYLNKKAPKIMLLIRKIKKKLKSQSCIPQWTNSKLPEPPLIDINSEFIRGIQAACTIMHIKDNP